LLSQEDSSSNEAKKKKKNYLESLRLVTGEQKLSPLAQGMKEGASWLPEEVVAASLHSERQLRKDLFLAWF
jgi:hypothetical protein